MTTEASSSNTQLLAGISSDFRALIEHKRARAIVVGIYDGGRSEVFTFGCQSESDNNRPTAGMIFETGSIGKVYTALLAQVLVNQGKLGWDNTIAEYLPDIVFASKSVAAITPRELATHTSGLPPLPNNMPFENPADPFAGYTQQGLFEFLADHSVDPLDKNYAYSNLGAGLLGVIAARAANTDYASAMHAEVLLPLGLSDTQVGLPDNVSGRLAAGYCDGVTMPNWGGSDALAGAGALTSNIRDMLRFIDLNLTNSDLNEELQAIQVSQGDGTTALGWHLQPATADDSPVIWHNGGTGGYASFLGIQPDIGRGVVVLASSTDYFAITELGFEQLYNRPRREPPAALESYHGVFQHDGDLVLTIYSEGRQLYGQASGQTRFPLRFIGNDNFEYTAEAISIEFRRTRSGPVEQFELLQEGARSTYVRVDDSLGIQRHTEVVTCEQSMTEFAGVYQLAPAVLITIQPTDNELLVAISGQPMAPVFAFSKDRFFYRQVDAELHFERDHAGQVIALTMHQHDELRAAKIS